jgi:ribosomal protein L30/L7E
MLAAVMIRGSIGIRKDMLDTLSMLRLRKKHSAVLLEEKPTTLGMLLKTKDFIAYGPVSEPVAKKLQAKMKNGVAHLNPPRGGFEHKGIKVAYAAGGALGKRESMDELLEAML